MKSNLVKAALLGSLACAGFGLSGCGRNVNGTYSDTTGIYVLELKAGGAATLTFMGKSAPCTYAKTGDHVDLDCHGASGKIPFTLHEDGSLTGPPGSIIPSLRKAKS